MHVNLLNVLAFWRPKKPPVSFTTLFRKFKGLIERNNRILELMGDMGDKLGGEYVFDKQYILSSCEQLEDLVFKLISDLSVLNQDKNVELFKAYERIRHAIHEELSGRHAFDQVSLTIPLESLDQGTVDAAGSKLNNLGIIRNTLGHRVPDGFVATTKAFFAFLDHNGLRRTIHEAVTAWDGKDEAAFDQMCVEIREKILKADIPKPLAADIMGEADALVSRLRREGDKGPHLFAVRSSAWGEDEESSFAGQYESELGIRQEGLLDAYKMVVAGAYSPQAWRYRIIKGFHEEELAMGVGFQLMIAAECSGTLQTYPADPSQKEVMVVNCTPGLGAPLMGGVIKSDTFYIERLAPFAVRSTHTEIKDQLLELNPEGGTVWKNLSQDEGKTPCISKEQLVQLARAGLDIESFLKRPVEAEWCYDADGELYILQARPIRFELQADTLPPPPAPDVEDTLMAGQGIIVQQGVASGKVFVVENDEDLHDFPYGAILVSHFTSPRFSRIMSHARGIITDIGSPAGHMATIAREHRVPTIVNAGDATTRLQTGEEITLDAGNNVVYRGIVPGLRRYELTSQCVFEESYEYRLLRRLLKRITPLHLVDPKSDDFRPSNCTTFHDITRYIHEKAVSELIQLSERRELHETKPRRLNLHMSLGLTVIDVEDGMCKTDEDLELKHVLSVPLKSLLDGMCQPGMWCTRPVSVDLSSFMSSFTRTFSVAATSRIGRNLAVVSKEYLNLHLQLGYHYNIIDAFLSESENDNYIYFRFLGGVTDIERRSRRASFIAEVLERFDFRVEVRGDLVVGRIKKISLARGIEKMNMLGGLVGYTRQLDVVLQSDEDVQDHLAVFMQQISNGLGEQDEQGQRESSNTYTG
ncbi:pyruvate, water dikinase [Oceanidesulfovibrio marinus]|uniref:Phosphoenolpyruvate synthase n=1 Tax=Oceanidesulfovibrio marinus TaxID=370038 RepID=A0A6P1ZBQ5_9BACT|nr:pyruvate, water dikinase [Oceanidesulfovibrio marinus]